MTTGLGILIICAFVSLWWAHDKITVLEAAVRELQEQKRIDALPEDPYDDHL